MIYPAADTLDNLGSKYALVIVAAKRARQVKEQARRVIATKSTNPITVALEEIAAGEITGLLVGEPEKVPESLPATPVLTGLVATSIDDEEPMHEPTAKEIGALLTPTEADEAFEADAVADDDVMQSEDDVMESEVDDAAEEGPYGLAVPGSGLDAGARSTAQDADDLMVDDADNETE